MRRKIVFATLCGLAVLVVGLVLFLRSLPSSCRVAVITVAVTNNVSGTRYATFRVTNVGRHPVGLVPIFDLENRSGQWRTNLIPDKAQVLDTNMVGVLGFHPRTKILEAGDSYVETLPLPFDDLGWRANFSYLDFPRPLESGVLDLFSRIGLAKRNDQTLVVSTEWTDR